MLSELVEELCLTLDIKYNVKIKTKHYKRKIATVSLKDKIIYINKSLVNKLSKEELKFIIAHELLHLKYGKYHIFDNELKKLFPNMDKILENICSKIAK
ncbi:M48 family metalloprotease [Methanocaldococcus indicus]|uniref:M48 family metalloprotease n=1 Tax=Methanocaldococcus indicus TaxID=213231 RepID=UPI003C6D4DBE